jgi:hypothetical protein
MVNAELIEVLSQYQIAWSLISERFMDARTVSS